MSRKPKKTNKQETEKIKNSLPLSIEESVFYDRIFKVFCGLILALMLGLSFGSGVNGDDQFQNDYSIKLIDYYTSFGKNKAALDFPESKMHYYGGFFDIITGLVNKVLGLNQYDAAYHDIRHLFSAFLGFLTILFSSLIAKVLAGEKAAILTLLFLFLSPRFLGHSLMNPKDIPFAAGYIISIYYLIQLLKALPRPRWQDALGFVLGSALAFSTRAGGLMLFGYLGLFLLLDLLEKRKEENQLRLKDLVFKYAAWVIGISLAGYTLALLFWPYGLNNPISNPLEALNEFSKLGIRIRVLFEGERILSNETPWYYALSWIYRTVPVFVLLGFVGCFVLVNKIIKEVNYLHISLLWFATLFPLGFIIIKNSLLHDGWRHLIFIYPTMVICAVLFWINLEKIVLKNKIIRYVFYGILGLLMLEPAWFIVKNYQYPYLYFQPLTGGLQENYGHYETDYWGISIKEAVNWMEEEGIVSENMTDTIIVATNFIYPAEVYLKKYGGNVRTKYTRFQGRYTQKWDYAIFPTRFIYGSQLLNKFPPSRTLHTIEAEGIPLSIIVEDKEKFAYRANLALEQKDTILAINQFQKELNVHDDNEQAWIGMASVYLELAEDEKTLYCAEEALKICPENVSGMYFKAMALLNMKRFDDAKATFEKAVKTDSEFYISFYYLGLIEMEKGNLEAALNYAKTTLEISPKFKLGHQLVADIYTKAGQKEKGEDFLRRMEKYK